jgi:hypothetical protein
MLADSEYDREKIQERIAALVSEHWDRTHRALLLSKLGGDLRSEFPNNSLLKERGLKSLLDIWPIVQVVKHPRIPEKIGAVPKSATLPGVVSELFEYPRQTDARRKHTIFYREFWRAFHTPIYGRRFVILPSGDQPGLQIVDRNDEPPSEEPTFEILQSDVVSLPLSAPMNEKTHATLASIEKWLKRNGLPEEFFIEQTVRPGVVMSSPRSEGLPAFAAGLAKLTPSEQARIFVPLDIVLRMISK